MSINTSNLITTRIGQGVLGNVHSINQTLQADHREITVKLLFPYIAISDKSQDDIAAITSSTDEEIKAEKCYAPVDVCQVTSYSEGTDSYENFAIGGLFNVAEDITGAKSVLLFCKTQIVDNRNKSKIISDNNQSAATILENEYGYTVTQVPFAYTMLLNSEGLVPASGISIGASKYGRSRHRFYFNYILNNNSGMADNITVNDNFYPYSDGYLSKTAFEDGLAKYEKAISEYQAEYEKYANGHKLYYTNVGEASKYASPCHKFLIKQFEDENDNFGADLYSENTNAGWTVWPESGSTYDNDTYKEYSPLQYGVPSGEDADRASIDRAMYFTYKDVRRVEYKTSSGTQTNYLPVYFEFLYFLRTSMPSGYGRNDLAFSDYLSYISTYHVLRVSYKVGTVLEGAFEIFLNDDTKMFAPICPSIGKISFDAKGNAEISILTEEVRVSDNPEYSGTNLYKSGGQFRLVTKSVTNTTTDAYSNVVEDIAYYESGQSFAEGSVGNLSPSGSLYPFIQPNFAAGYVFSNFVKTGGSSLVVGNNSVYVFPKDFDCSVESNFTTPSILQTGVLKMTVAAAMAKSQCIINDIMVSKSESTMDGQGVNYVLKDGTVITQSLYSEELANGNNYRLAGDFRLHNARVIMLDNAVSSFYMSISNDTELLINIYAGNNVYELSTTYGAAFGNSISGVQNINQVEITGVNISKTQLGSEYDVGVSYKVHYKNGDENEWKCDVISSTVWSNLIKRYVAIEDYAGNINVVEETVY